jgi:uncharacterized protein (DUF1697 family)
VTTWIVLLRGINVVGNNRLPMKGLATLLEREGFEEVRTYIQSGNVVLRSARGTSNSLTKRIGTLVLKGYGFQPQVIALSVGELASAAAANPFPKAEADHKALHLFFLAATPRSPDLESLKRLRTGRETFALKGKVCYLHTPDGFPASKLAARAERCIGVGATARNWRTVTKLLEMVRVSE